MNHSSWRPSSIHSQIFQLVFHIFQQPNCIWFFPREFRFQCIRTFCCLKYINIWYISYLSLWRWYRTNSYCVSYSNIFSSREDMAISRVSWLWVPLDSWSHSIVCYTCMFAMASRFECSQCLLNVWYYYNDQIVNALRYSVF